MEGAVQIPEGYSVAIETTAGGGGWTDLGLTMEGGEVALSYDKIDITSSVGTPVYSAIKNMIAKISISLIQLEQNNLAKLLGGISTVTPVAGDPVPITGETLVANAWDFNTFYPFEHQSGDGTVPTSISATNTGGTPVAGTDYFVTESGDGSGIWGVVIIDTDQTAKTANFVLAYTYTPSVSITHSVGSKSIEMVPRALKIYNTKVSFELYSVTNDGGMVWSFPRSDDDNPVTMSLELTAKVDTTRSDKDQLFKITDTWGVAGI